MADPINTRCDLMMFGALGDLAQRKLFPALYQLERAGLLHKGSRILAIARNKADSNEVRKTLLGKLKEHVKKGEFDADVAEQFLQREPKSIAAVFYPSTCTSSSTKGRFCKDAVKNMHKQLLAQHGLSPAEIPLFRLDVHDLYEPFVEVFD